MLGLFDDHVAFEAGIGDGIALQRLVPFHYFGLHDPVDYAPIPWRNHRFDPGALSTACQTEARMQATWTAWERHPGTRTLVFCCTIAHARFAGAWLRARGVRAAVVHSGPESDDRALALRRLADGSVDAVCAVDLFNEGIDVPSVDRVIMLRPTESPVVFLQQLGRGLRTHAESGKTALTVIDFVGNHRVFLDRVRTLVSLGPATSPASLRDVLEGRREPELPAGCSVELDVSAIDVLGRLLPAGAQSALLVAYRELRASRGRRPTIGELYRLGFNPRSLKSAGGWFELVASEGDLTAEEQLAFSEAEAWLTAVEVRETMNKCFKMVALQALLEGDGLLDGMAVSDLSERSRDVLRRSPELLADVPSALRDANAEDWASYWKEWPLLHWAGGGKHAKDRPWFRLEAGRFEPRFRVSAAARSALVEMPRARGLPALPVPPPLSRGRGRRRQGLRVPSHPQRRRTHPQAPRSRGVPRYPRRRRRRGAG